jgi:hypothetical protein
MQGRSPAVKGMLAAASIVGLSALLLLQPGISTAQTTAPAAAAEPQGPPQCYGCNGSSSTGTTQQTTMVNETAFWREISRKNGHTYGIPELNPTAAFVRGTGKTNVGNTTNFSSPNTRPI